MKADVLIESVKHPGTTKLVAPVFAGILCTLGLYRRRDLAPERPAKAPRKTRSTEKPARSKRIYKTRRLTAEE
jgi:hypothetical protein